MRGRLFCRKILLYANAALRLCCCEKELAYHPRTVNLEGSGDYARVEFPSVF